MTDHEKKQQRSRFVTWLKRAFVLAIVSAALIGVLVVINLPTAHELVISNTSGREVRFEKGTRRR